MEKLLYTGLKVSIKDVEQHIFTSLLESYKRNKYLFITKVNSIKDVVYVSYAPEGAIVEAIEVKYIEPIYDRDLNDVLWEKGLKCLVLENEIHRIKAVIDQQKNTK